MFKLGSKGGEVVKGGTYWNFDTGEKIIIQENEVLPGKSSQLYSKLPPATVPTLALILVGVLPGYLSGLYGAYVETLMEAYVVFGYLFIGTVLVGLSIMVFRDRSALTRTMKIFRFKPGELVHDRESELALIKVQGRRIEKE